MSEEKPITNIQQTGGEVRLPTDSLRSDLLSLWEAIPETRPPDGVTFHEGIGWSLRYLPPTQAPLTIGVVEALARDAMVQHLKTIVCEVILAEGIVRIDLGSELMSFMESDETPTETHRLIAACRAVHQQENKT